MKAPGELRGNEKREKKRVNGASQSDGRERLADASGASGFFDAAITQ
jgi:hypothetical protein